MSLVLGILISFILIAFVIRVIKEISKLIYDIAPFVVVWTIIFFVLYNVGYLDPFKEEVGKIYADVVGTVEDKS